MAGEAVDGRQLVVLAGCRRVLGQAFRVARSFRSLLSLGRERERSPRTAGDPGRSLQRIPWHLGSSRSYRFRPIRGCSWSHSLTLQGAKASGVTLHLSLRSIEDASSAGVRRSLRSLDHSAPRDRDGREESQEMLPPLPWVFGTEERLQERPRKGPDLDRRHETTSPDFPERRLRKVLTPETLPSSDCPSVGADEPGQLANPAWCRPLPHGGDQDHEDAEVHLAAKETHRWRCDSLAATVTIAAEAQSVQVFFRQAIRTATRLPGIVGRM